MTQHSSPFPGRWVTERFEYHRGPMEAYSAPAVRLVVLRWATQTGKTEIQLNCMGWSIDQAPGPILAAYPSEKVYKKVSGTRIQPMINSCECLSRKRHPNPDKFKLEEMHFTDCTLFIASAQTPSDLASTPIQYLFGDELGKWPLFSGKEGDPVKLAMDRQKSFPYSSKALLVSSPTTKKGQISMYFDTCQVKLFYWVPCPGCGEFQRLVFGQIKWDKLLDVPSNAPAYWDHAEKTAVYSCLHCEREITDADKGKMLKAGVWADEDFQRPDFSKIQSGGFQLSSLYSPLLTWGKIAREFLECKDDPNKLMNFVNGWLAEEWEDIAVEEKEPSEILERNRTELPPLTVPAGALCLTMGIDSALAGFSYVVRAHLPDRTSYLVDFGFAPSFRELETIIFERSYPIQGTPDHMVVFRAAIDTGGTALDDGSSMTEAVYTWLRKSSRGIVFGIKGSSWRTGRRVQQKIMDKMPGRFGVAIPGGLVLFLLDVSAFKEALHYRLSLKPDEAGAFLFHSQATEEYAAQLLGERKVRETKTGKVKWVKTGENHFLDAEVYAMACIDDEWLGGLRRIREPLGVKRTILKPQEAAQTQPRTDDKSWFENPRAFRLGSWSGRIW